ncbi:hypothetical protein CSUI_008959 [Cystoisospora suis]|uniref:Uncharacterized protein n=1 Tax=Cystoisospora suis TaxID=483139 RepID=A0A2C6KI41_9APIC|nr:hypothetical protein CSUI_008959 [Cystoisospora suis]
MPASGAWKMKGFLLNVVEFRTSLCLMVSLCSVSFLLCSGEAGVPENRYDITRGGASGDVSHLYSVLEESGVVDAQKPTRSQRTADKRLSRQRSSSTGGRSTVDSRLLHFCHPSNRAWHRGSL